jgi:ATP-dependent helicase/nuclease subunit A
VSNNRIVDAPARELAVDVHRSLIISAPAGSGKTGLLSLRVLKLLAICEQPEEILAITFTRKAAKEMQFRIIEALEFCDQTHDEPQDPYLLEIFQAGKAALNRDAKCEWAILNNPHRLRILTIDGFCKSLAEQLPFFSGMGLNTQIIDNPNSLYTAVARSFSQHKLKNDNDGLFSRLLTHLNGDLDRIESLFSQFLSNRDQWLTYALTTQYNEEDARNKFEHYLQSLCRLQISSVVEVLIPYECEIFDLCKHAHSNLDGVSANKTQLESILRYGEFPSLDENDIDTIFWRSLSGFLLKTDGALRNTVDKRNGFPSGDKKDPDDINIRKKAQFVKILSELKSIDGLEENLCNNAHLPQTHYSDEQWSILISLVRLLPEIAAHLNLEFVKLASCDFTEFSLAALRALDPSNLESGLLERLDYRLRHVLVDEFQDTSKSQLELLERLTNDWSKGDGKTLFVVGDAMQSCYSFRNANVGIFLRTVQNGLPHFPLEHAQLSVNFRSSEQIVAWVNKVFSKCFPHTMDISRGAVNYSESFPFKASDPCSKVSVLGIISDNTVAVEADQLSKSVNALLSKDVFNSSHESIAVLARNRGHLSEIVKSFKENNIPYQAVEIDRLVQRQSIIDIHNLTRVLCNRYDEIALLALLRAPWLALNNIQLFTLFNCKKTDERDIWGRLYELINERPDEISPELIERLARFVQVMECSIVNSGGANLLRRLESCWVKLGGALLIMDDSDGVDLESYYQLIQRYERHNTIPDFQQFEFALDQLYASPQSNLEGGIVQLLTMHKSKGLEFDHVFIPGLARGSRPDDPQLIYWYEGLDAYGQNAYLLSPIADSHSDNVDGLSQYIRRELSHKQNLENTRLFYVACTRARITLTLFGECKRDKKGDVHAKGSNSLFAKIWPLIKDNVEIVEPLESLPSARNEDLCHTEAIKPYIPRLVAPPNDSLFIDDSRPVDPLFDNAHLKLNDEWASLNHYSRALGTVFHRILRAEFHLKHHNRDANSRSKRWRSQLIQFGCPKKHLNSTVDEFEQTLINLRNDDKSLWVLDSSHDESQFELAVTAKNGGFNIIDRTFIEGDTRWVIDFKSSKPKPCESIESFVSKELNAYQEQLVRYVNCLQEFDLNFDKPAPKHYRAALFFPFAQIFSEYSQLKA